MRMRARVICFHRSRAHPTRGERLRSGNRSIGIDVNRDSRQWSGRRSLQNAKSIGGIKNSPMRRADEVPSGRIVIDPGALVGTGPFTRHPIAIAKVDQETALTIGGIGEARRCVRCLAGRTNHCTRRRRYRRRCWLLGRCRRRRWLLSRRRRRLLGRRRCWLLGRR